MLKCCLISSIAITSRCGERRKKIISDGKFFERSISGFQVIPESLGVMLSFHYLFSVCQYFMLSVIAP